MKVEEMYTKQLGKGKRENGRRGWKEREKDRGRRNRLK